MYHVSYYLALRLCAEFNGTLLILLVFPALSQLLLGQDVNIHWHINQQHYYVSQILIPGMRKVYVLVFNAADSTVSFPTTPTTPPQPIIYSVFIGVIAALAVLVVAAVGACVPIIVCMQCRSQKYKQQRTRRCGASSQFMH